MKSKIDIVIPMHNESGCIRELCRQLDESCHKCINCKFNYIFIDDGSDDNTLEIVKEISSLQDNITIIELSRNFGKEIATTAGLQYSKNDAVIIMDADLQHPPKYIPEFIEKWREGYEIVSSKRKSIENREFLKRIGSKIYYRIINAISHVNMTSQTTDYRLLDKSVVNHFKKFEEKKRLVRGIIDWMGFKTAYVEFEAPKRFAGNASYSYSKLFSLALNSLVTFSVFPLKIIAAIGLFIMLMSLLGLGIFAIDFYSFNYFNFTFQGFFLLLITFMSGLTITSLGLVAFYISIIHTEVLNRPLYLIRDIISQKHNDFDEK